MRACRFSRVKSARDRVRVRVEHRSNVLVDLLDRDDAVSHPARSRQPFRDRSRRVGVETGGHVIGGDAIGAERVNRNGQRERRVDAARDGDDRAIEAGLPHVIAQRHDEAVVDLAIAVRSAAARIAGCHRGRADVHDQELFFELTADRDQASGPVVDEAFAVERNDVLAVVGGAGRVDVDERFAEHGEVAANDLVALLPLAGTERRRVQVQQDVGSLGDELRERLDVVELVPEIFANRDAQSSRHRRAIGTVTGSRTLARHEESLVVEIAIAREQRLVRALQDLTVADDGGGVVLCGSRRSRCARDALKSMNPTTAVMPRAASAIRCIARSLASRKPSSSTRSPMQ